MKKTLTPQQEEKLKQLIDEHNTLCEKFEDRIHELYDEIEKICQPAGLTASRVSTFRNEKEVTRIYIQPDFIADDEEIDPDWILQLWNEDDRL